MSLFISQFNAELGIALSETPTPPLTPPTVRTGRFDAGLRALWMVTLQLSDSGVDLRDKTIKATRITGKITEPNFRVYAYAPTEEIDVEAIEAGTGSRTGARSVPSTTQVVQSARVPINVANAMLHTIQWRGTWDGVGMKDRIDEIVYELAIQGIRR